MLTFRSPNVYHHLMLSREQLLLTLFRSQNCNSSNWWQCNYSFTVKIEVISLPHIHDYTCKSRLIWNRVSLLNVWIWISKITWTMSPSDDGNQATVIHPKHIFIIPFSCRNSFFRIHTAFNTMSYHLQYTATTVTKITGGGGEATVNLNVSFGGLNQESSIPRPRTGTGPRPVRNRAARQEVSGRWASEASRAAPHRSPRSHYRLNCPPTNPRVRGKIIFHETSPWCQKGWGPLA